MKEKLGNFFKANKMSFSWRRIWITLVIVIVIFGTVFTALVVYTDSYSDRVLPGVYIGGVPIGGMEKGELRFFLQDMNDKLVNEGLKFSFETIAGEKKEFLLSPIIISEENSIEMLTIDVDREVESLLNYGKTGDLFSRLLQIISSRTKGSYLSLQYIMGDKDKILGEIKEMIEPYETEAQNSSVEISSFVPLSYIITSSTPGVSYQFEAVVGQIVSAWSVFKSPHIFIPQKRTEPKIKEADVVGIGARLPVVFSYDGLQLAYTDPHNRREYSWWIKTSQIQAWLEVQKTEKDEVGFGLKQDEVISYFKDNIAPIVNVEAKNAKFKMNEYGKVVEFQGSRPGISLNLEETYTALNNAILQRTWHDEGIVSSVRLAVQRVEPDIKTGEVNDLGITELLGAGVSNFRGSPTNRVKNIRNAVNKLNGVLVKPGEEFSAIKYTAPFTFEGGYLPELVIKGDRIKPEVGGGLCQIGTTLFRMAMNGGMEITRRQNHSLVVAYYNDPVNGLPGTDATIYDPAPDFRFKNDTSNYVLIQTAMDLGRMELIFTLWGTNDGRKGYYTRPVVSHWIPHGETRVIETTDLALGERQCQHAYTGADANFTYIREFPDGQKEERVFESHYRPLPEICLVGVEEKAKCDAGSEDCEAVVEGEEEGSGTNGEKVE